MLTLPKYKLFFIGTLLLLSSYCFALVTTPRECFETSRGSIGGPNVDHYYTIIGYNCPEIKDVVIPSDLGPFELKRIGYEAFQGYGLTSVVIPEGVEYIGQNAFKWNQLTEVILPNSLLATWYGAFSYNKISKIKLPENLGIIGPETFAYNLLTEINLANVHWVEYRAFTNNKLLKVEIPRGVILRENAFSHNKIEEIKFCSNCGVISIGDYAFSRNKLTKLNLPEGVSRIGKSAFGYNKINSVVFPDTLMEIGDHAFWFNDLLKVELPANTRLGEQGSFAKHVFDEHVEVVRRQ